MSDEDTETEWEEHISFVGCTCEHDPYQHSWVACTVEDCDCEGSWEE